VALQRVFAPGKIDPALRRRVMASIRKADTRPELTLRSALWRAGVRGWRCNVRLVAGTPDLVFSRWNVAVFCDGVWWHGHPEYLPRGRRGAYWDAKIASNVARDKRVNRMLRRNGWTVVRVWDVDVLANPSGAVKRVVAALRARGWRVPALMPKP
jgi:DNA mismatch endonuclease, patch repair protein